MKQLEFPQEILNPKSDRIYKHKENTVAKKMMKPKAAPKAKMPMGKKPMPKMKK